MANKQAKAEKLTDSSSDTIMRSSDPQNIISADLVHIPRGDISQNKLRQYFQYARSRSLTVDCEGAKENALKEAIDKVRADCPEFEPNYDKSYFLKEDNTGKLEEIARLDLGLPHDPSRECVLISLCICGVPCRYHGLTHKMGHRLYKEKKVTELKSKYNLIPVCPETIGGLPTPRCPCKVTWNGDIPIVTNRKTGDIAFNGIDLTEAYNRGAEWTLWMAQIFNCKKAYMLKMSPACDPRDGIAARMLAKNGVSVIGV